jgi:O-antigen/teichoic acid export membrane protein
VLAKLGTPEMVGEYAYALSITSPIMLLACLQLRSVQATDARGVHAFGVYFGLRILLLSCALVVIWLVVNGARIPNGTALIVGMTALTKCAEAISDVLFGALQLGDRMDQISRSLIAKGLLSAIAFAAGVYVTGSVFGGVSGLLLATTAVLLGYDLPVVTRMLSHATGAWWRETAIRPCFRFRDMRTLTMTALPLGVAMFMASLNGVVPRYFVEHHLGMRELGLFSAVGYLVVVGSMVMNSVGQTLTSRMARLHVAGDRSGYMRLAMMLVGLAVALGSAGVALAFTWGREILSILYRSEYADAQPILAWIAVVALLTYVGSAFGYSLTAARAFTIQAPLLTVATAIVACGSYVLVPRTGLLGAVAAMALSQGVLVVGSAAVFGKIMRPASSRV